MLQQTQVARVIEPYCRFIEMFPTPSACATSAAGDVLRAWSGLGYNRRALNLHRAAESIERDHGGRVPDDLSALKALPGIGDYTARAVLSFAFGYDVGVVDTNVARLLARAVAGRSLGAAEAQRLADDLVPSGDGWAFNQALFDLGAAHCTSRAPRCGDCPVRRSCAWAASGYCLPDPAKGSAGTARPQARFDGSDRQGRGRLLAALRSAPVRRGELAAAAGWSNDPDRAGRIAAALVSEGFAGWRGDVLELR